METESRGKELKSDEVVKKGKGNSRVKFLNQNHKDTAAAPAHGYTQPDVTRAYINEDAGDLGGNA